MSEDTVIMIDVSNSMWRKDSFGHSRLFWAFEGLKQLVLKKIEIDSNDRYSVVLFSDVAISLKEMVYELPPIIEFVKENANFSSGSDLGQGLTAAVKIIVNELKKIGQKTTRIIIFSDGRENGSTGNPLKIAKIGKDLGIIIDVLRFGPANVPGNLLKTISEITGGTYHYITDQFELSDILVKTAKKKEHFSTALLNDKRKETLNMLEVEIADPLLKLEEINGDQRQSISLEKKDLKCSICYQLNCQVCETGFYGCGRFCPNCYKPVHLHCAIKWAEQQNNDIAESSQFRVLRCPFCYYLLKIPILSRAATVEEAPDDMKIITKVKFSDELPQILDSVCADPDCGIMFDDTIDPYIYKCQACNSYFHADCLHDHYAEDRHCPYCKSKCVLKN